jgi:hypothetical protein
MAEGPRWLFILSGSWWPDPYLQLGGFPAWTTKHKPPRKYEKVLPVIVSAQRNGGN